MNIFNRKRYCSNCKYYRNYQKECSNIKLAKDIKEDWEGVTYIIPHPKELNKNNDCKGWKQYYNPKVL